MTPAVPDPGAGTGRGGGLQVTDGGVHATVQDLGRADAGRWGVPRAGAVDADALRLGNGLVGNPPGAAAIEVLVGGLAVAVEAPGARVALAAVGGPPGAGPGGDHGARLEVTGSGRRVVPAWAAVDVAVGACVRVVPAAVGAAGAGAGGGAAGPAYLVVAGGVDVPVVMGSRSTDLRAGFGGWEGRRLAAGDRLPVGVPGPAGTPGAAGGPPLELVPPPSAATGPLRVVPGPHRDRLAGDALATLMTGTYVVGPDADRMGLRLSGPALPWAEDGRPEMLSGGVVPGTIQVPSGGDPILLLADCQTTGGYPQVAVVCTADLARAGRLRPGDEVRFAALTVAEAHALLRDHEAALAERLARARPVTPPPDLSALHGANLVSGVVDAGDG